MLTHSEQSICHIQSNLFCGSMTKILSTVTEKFHGFFGVFLMEMKMKTGNTYLLGFMDVVEHKNCL